MNTRVKILTTTIAALVLAPLARAGPHAAPSSAAPQAAPTDSMTIPALGLSYHGQYLAWIVARPHQTTLMLASWTGSNARAVPIPGGCTETGLRWAGRWNTLAVLTQCPANASDAHIARSAIWVVDAGSRNAAPRKVAEIIGTASDLQWRTDDKVIAFLYTPDGATLQGIAAVPAAGGTPQLTTPAGWNVHGYRLLPQSGGVMYTADAGVDSDNEAPTLYLQTGRVPKVLFDPATATGALHGLRVSLPGLNQWILPTFVSFLGRRAGGAGGNIYSFRPFHGKPFKDWGSHPIAWYTYEGDGTVFTAPVDGGVRVSSGRYPFTVSGAISHSRYAFTVPGTISDGSTPFSVAVPHPHDFGFPNGAWGAQSCCYGYSGGGASIAFVQTLPGQPPVIRAGHFSTEPPPIVWPADAKVAMVAH